MTPGQTSATEPLAGVPALYIPSRRNGRRFAVVSRVLGAAGIRHRAVFPPLRLLRLGKIERSAINSEYCEASWRMPRELPLLITDQPGAADKAQKVIEISYDLAGAAGRPLSADEIYHPILFHPDQITEEAYAQANAFSGERKRPLALLFAGNCDPATYDTPEMEENFGLLNRHALHQLARQLPAELTVFPRTPEELAALLEEATNSGKPLKKLVWIDTQDFRIPAAQWLNLVAKANFFLCTPGVRYPWCQNLNEAMACGTVPVLQYPHLYNPALTDSADSLAFAGKADFEATVRNALKMPESKVARLSAAACQYHEDHLSLARIIAGIRAFADDPGRRKLIWYLAGKA